MKRSFNKQYTLLICLGLVLVTVVAFEPIRHNDFVDYDDARYITENRQVQAGLTWESAAWAFTTFNGSNWHPLTWLSHMLDYQLFGLNPPGHHLVNLLFHIVNSLLLFLVLKSMTRAIWASAFVAAAFAVHPMHVESVAWAAERKDVLSTFFWLGTMAAYVRYARGPSVGKYILVVLFFAFGLMAKPMLVTLPFVLLLLDGWPLGRFQSAHISRGETQSRGRGISKASTGQLIKEKIPLFALVVASCIVTFIAQRSGGAVMPVEIHSFGYRLANGLVSYVGYINKMAYPRDLAVLYPLAKLISTQQLIFCFLELAAISVVVYLFRRRSYLAVGWLWYLGTLVPVIGLVQVGTQSMADRYSYVPLIGIFIMFVWGMGDILAKWRFQRIGVGILVSIIFIAMTIGTRKQVGYWQNSVTLFEHTLEITQNNFMIQNNLGGAYMNLGRYQEGIDACKQALAIKSDHVEAYSNLGIGYFNLNRSEEAIDAFKQAILLKSDFIDAYLNLGVAYHKLSRYEDEIDAYKQAVDINPNSVTAHYNLVHAYLAIGDKKSTLNEHKILKALDKKKANELIDMINNN